MSHYATLGITENATTAEIKTAFRKLASEHHPDKGGSEEKFKQINEAYHVLKEDSTRQQYDAQRRMGANPFGNGPFRQQRTSPFHNGDFGDFSFTFTDDGMNAGGFSDGQGQGLWADAVPKKQRGHRRIYRCRRPVGDAGLGGLPHSPFVCGRPFPRVL